MRRFLSRICWGGDKTNKQKEKLKIVSMVHLWAEDVIFLVL